MTIDLGNSIRKTSNVVFSSNFLNNILGNSIFVAVIITVIFMLLVMVMYPAKRGTSGLVLIKMLIYMFFGSLLVVFLHDGVIKHTIEEANGDRESTDFMRGTTMEGKDIVYGQTRPVQPSAVQPSAVQSNAGPSNVMQSNTVQSVESQVQVTGGDGGEDILLFGGSELPEIKPVKAGVNKYL